VIDDLGPCVKDDKGNWYCWDAKTNTFKKIIFNDIDVSNIPKTELMRLITQISEGKK